MDTTTNDPIEPGGEHSGNLDPELEYRLEGFESADSSGRHFRSMKPRQRKRAKPKPARPGTYIGQRGNRRSRKSR